MPRVCPSAPHVSNRRVWAMRAGAVGIVWSALAFAAIADDLDLQPEEAIENEINQISQQITRDEQALQQAGTTTPTGGTAAGTGPPVSVGCGIQLLNVCSGVASPH